MKDMKQVYLDQFNSKVVFKNNQEFEDFVKGLVIDVYEENFKNEKQIDEIKFYDDLSEKIDSSYEIWDEDLIDLLKFFGLDSLKSYLKDVDFNNDENYLRISIRQMFWAQTQDKMEELGGYKMILEEVGIEIKNNNKNELELD